MKDPFVQCGPYVNLDGDCVFGWMDSNDQKVIETTQDEENEDIIKIQRFLFRPTSPVQTWVLVHSVISIIGFGGYLGEDTKNRHTRISL